MKERFDVAVVGSGFAGSLMAMIAQQLGLRVVLLERGRHPRVVVGESSTPLSNLLLEEIATRYSLTNLRPLCKWGSWRDKHPELACGLKRGFSFFHHPHGYQGPVAREHQLLVAASPRDAIADTHWYRADFDAFLVSEAQKLGVVYLDETDLSTFAESDRAVRLTGTHHGCEIAIEATFLVDATGPRGYLHRVLGLGERELPGIPATSGLWSHFEGVRRLDETGGLTLDEEPPYPVDDAAVHHLIDGGWVWVLRFSNGVTSAGIAATASLANELRLMDGEAAWSRILLRIPVLREQFRDATAVQPFRHIPRMPFRSARIAGRSWALLPSAAGFVDPLLSTGFPLTLLGITRLAKIFEHHWATESFATRVDEYAMQTDAELLATARMLGALYANLGNFPAFAAVSQLYFAAASYAEAARRLGRPELAPSFLLHDHPAFGPECARVLERARCTLDASESTALIEDIRQVIEPVNVAGLADPARRNWYPADAEDLLRSAHKLGASQQEVIAMLERCGFSLTTSSRP